MYLIVITGSPCSGKTTISKYLQPKFVRFESDTMRDMLYGTEYIKFRESNDYSFRNRLMYEMMSDNKKKVLLNGYDVVVDSTASRNEGRKAALELDLELKIQRILLHIDVDKEILIQRNIDKRRPRQYFENWYFNIWEPISDELKPYVIKLQNNTESDLEAIKNFLDKTFLSKNTG